MKKPSKWLEEHRLAGEPGLPDGAFSIPLPDSPAKALFINMIVSDGDGWDHVSAHVANADGSYMRQPMWHEMVYIKGLWFKDEECVIQYHPAKKDYINCHPYVLHLWRPQDFEIPMPPKDMV